MKSTLTLTILITGAALLTGICAEEQTTIPADRDKEAQQTFADGKHYFIWPATNAPIKPEKFGTSPLPGGDPPNWLKMPIKFKAKNDVHEPFCLRYKIVAKNSDTGATGEITSTWTDKLTADKASGQATAVYLPLGFTGEPKLVAGKGEATIFLIKKADAKNKDAKPISNATTIKIIMAP